MIPIWSSARQLTAGYLALISDLRMSYGQGFRPGGGSTAAGRDLIVNARGMRGTLPGQPPQPGDLALRLCPRGPRAAPVSPPDARLVRQRPEVSNHMTSHRRVFPDPVAAKVP